VGYVANRVVILLALPACGFQGTSNSTPPGDATGSIDAPGTSIDAAPVTCGSLSCDPNAVCDDTGATATCHCPDGFDDPAMNGLSCHDQDECAIAENCDDACENTVGSYVCYTPKSCKEAHDHHAPPGDTTLYFGGDHDKPWTAFCDGDNDYLTLPQGSGKNYAQYTHSIPGQEDRRTTYQRVRIDPATLIVDTKDGKYTSSSGNAAYGLGAPAVDKVSYGVAISCADLATGSANVDLTGTPFRVKRAQGPQGQQQSPWTLSGSSPAGNATPTSNDQVWSITGAGHCGWSAPSPSSSQQPPINGTGGKLPLEFLPVANPG